MAGLRETGPRGALTWPVCRCRKLRYCRDTELTDKRTDAPP
jgi:hypothetical protein